MRNCEKSKVLHWAWGGRWETWQWGRRQGVEFISRKEAGGSTEQLKCRLPDRQKHELFPSLHQYYFQTSPISWPFEKFASSSSLTMKWFKQGNSHQSLQTFCFSKVVFLSLHLNLFLIWFRELHVKERVRMIVNANIKCWEERKKKSWPGEII